MDRQYQIFVKYVQPWTFCGNNNLYLLMKKKVINVCETVLGISRWTGNAYFSFNFTNFAPNLFIMKMDLEIIP